MRLVVTITTMLILFSGMPAFAQGRVYRWVDKRGVVHYTDDPEQLPEPQRSEALRKLDASQFKKKSSSANSSSQGRALPRPGQRKLPAGPADNGNPLPATETLELDRGQQTPLPDPRENWKRILGDARSRIGKLEQECQRHQQQRDLSRRQALIFAKPGANKQAGDAEEQLRICQKKLEQARREYEKLKQQARRQGMPRALWDR